MATNDFLPFAGGAGANALDQADYEALTALSAGFTSGVAPSAACNKVWRQSTIMAAVLAQLIVDNTGEDAVDDGTTTTLLANLKAATAGRLINIQTFATAGTFTFTPSPGTTWLRAIVVGAGGGSGGTQATGAGVGACGSSGGGGGWAEGIITTGFSGATVTVGAGGSAGAAGGSGGAGGTSSFGPMSATGGAGGPFSVGTSSLPTAVTGAQGGVGSGGSIINGTGSRAAAGLILSVVAVVPGVPGTAFFGGQQPSATITSAPGVAAVMYGAGASGAAAGQSAAAQVGAAGFRGIVIVYEYA